MPVTAQRARMPALLPFLHRISVVCAVALCILPSSLAKAQDRSDVRLATEDWPSLSLARMPGAYDYPVHITHAGDGSGRLFVVEKTGLIRIIHNGEMLPEPFLDIRDRVNADCNECGLLSVAFPPDFETGAYFFVYYTAREDLAEPEPSDNGRDSGNDSVVARFHVTIDPNSASSASEERILVRNQPYTNHNGGMIAFGPDGNLYVALGDGGGGGDPLDSGQTTNTLLGKILRIEVSRTGEYAIPADNPFVGSPDHRPEIWALGLRNPWRISFDRLLGDLYIADVGQSLWEEINYQSAASTGGENYGWNIMEGTHCYDASQCDQAGLTLPVAEYPHPDDGCASVTGGTVYRGSRPYWHAVYFFADFCSGQIFGLRRSAGAWESTELLKTELLITSFGEDESGEVYLVGRRRDGADADRGVVFRLTDAQAHYLPALFAASNE